jgi:uncharacterized membrane protein
LGKKDRLDKELSFLQERYKNIFMVFFGILVGVASTLFYVVSGDKPPQVLGLGVVGIMMAIGVYINLKSVKKQIEDKLDDLEELE